jgi:hypothetical protein
LQRKKEPYKAEDEKLEKEAKQKETAEKQKLVAKTMPSNVGLFLYAIDTQIFKVLEFAIKEQWNGDFYNDSETLKICLSENICPTDIED